MTPKDQILQNLANLDLINFCKYNRIDCSNTKITKVPRKYTYQLQKIDTNETIAQVTFYKSQVPSRQLFIANHAK